MFRVAEFLTALSRHIGFRFQALDLRFGLLGFEGLGTQASG